MGHELSTGVSSTRLVQKQQNIFGRTSSFWNVVLQGPPVQQNGGDLANFMLVTTGIGLYTSQHHDYARINHLFY